MKLPKWDDIKFGLWLVWHLKTFVRLIVLGGIFQSAGMPDKINFKLLDELLDLEYSGEKL